MQKIFLTSMAVFGISTFCGAANANIGANAESASCDNSTIGASSGTTTLEAQWQANTITINWYNDGEQFTPTNSSAAGECTYDQAMVLPSNNLSKEGYTFDGWTVKAAAAPAQCNIPSSYLNEDTYTFASKGLNESRCEGADGWDNENDDLAWFGTDEDGSCNDSEFSHLDWGEWSVSFSAGMVKGEAICSGKSGNNHSWQWGGNSADWTSTESELTSASGEKKYCWCKATNYIPNVGNSCSLASSSWVLYYDDGDAGDCVADCAYNCANAVRRYSGFRAAVFGNAQ